MANWKRTYDSHPTCVMQIKDEIIEELELTDGHVLSLCYVPNSKPGHQSYWKILNEKGHMTCHDWTNLSSSCGMLECGITLEQAKFEALNAAVAWLNCRINLYTSLRNTCHKIMKTE